MKKVLKVILMLTLVLSVCVSFVACGGEKDSDVKNVKGLHLKKAYDDDANAYYIVTGYTVEDGFDGKLTIPSEKDGVPVTEIKEKAFKENSNITEIVVPSSVEKIGAGAFTAMTKLGKITIPFVGAKTGAVDSARTLAHYFGTTSYKAGISITSAYNPSSSSTVYVPKTLTTVVVNSAEDYEVPDYAFSGFKYLTEITLNDKVAKIGNFAFNGCAKIENVNLIGVKVIGDSAFAGCEKLVNVPLGSRLTSIGKEAFKGLNLTAITIPDAVTYVGDKAFEDCEKLAALTIGGGLTEIRAYTFANCKALTTIAVANGVLDVRGGAFLNVTVDGAAVFPNATLHDGWNAVSYENK